MYVLQGLIFCAVVGSNMLGVRFKPQKFLASDRSIVAVLLVVKSFDVNSAMLQIVHDGQCCGSVAVLIPIPHQFPDEEKLLVGPMLSAV